jgi:cytochrome c-type biogenesis protein CcmH/NrfG
MFEESISCLKIFLKQNPRDTENLILLWASFVWIWKNQDAINAYKRVLELQPYNEEIKKEIDELSGWIL